MTRLVVGAAVRPPVQPYLVSLIEGSVHKVRVPQGVRVLGARKGADGAFVVELSSGEGAKRTASARNTVGHGKRQRRRTPGTRKATQ